MVRKEDLAGQLDSDSWDNENDASWALTDKMAILRPGKSSVKKPVGRPHRPLRSLRWLRCPVSAWRSLLSPRSRREELPLVGIWALEAGTEEREVGVVSYC